MSLKSKAKAQKKRDRCKFQREQEQQALAANVERLKTMTSGFARTNRTDADVRAFEQAKMPVYAQSAVKVSHVEKRFIGPEEKPKQVLSPEMARREQQAQERYREIQKRVDIGYNKGGLMLLSEGEVEAMRRGELRRRS